MVDFECQLKPDSTIRKSMRKYDCTSESERKNRTSKRAIREKNSEYWAVRSVWDEVFASKETLGINMRVDETLLFMRLFQLGGTLEGKPVDPIATRKKVVAVIQKHMATDTIQLAAQ